ncbi:hypothetical protein V1514DRAFT_166104 [Lipomyces japonicus]|uniref:uncharacterized protein n=1 Tax=Lipomyces japonicus TaxID=56871 RepID=UPI0034CFE45B
MATDFATNLQLWAKTNGIIINSVAIKQSENSGLGIFANDRIEISEKQQDEDEEPVTLISVPRNMIISAEMVTDYGLAYSTSFNRLIDISGLSGREKIVRFFVFGLHEFANPVRGAGPQAVFAPYFAGLPRIATTPVAWSDEKIARLYGTSIYEAVVAKRTVLAEEFDRFQQVFEDSFGEHVRFEEYVVADFIVSSRSMQVLVSETSESVAVGVVPVIDFANHATNTADVTAKYEITNQDVRLELVSSSIESGQEIKISYGRDRSTGEILFNYGFVEPEPEHDSIRTRVVLDDDDVVGKVKERAYGKRALIELGVDDQGRASWECEFTWLLAATEEDGVRVQVAQDVDGTRTVEVVVAGTTAVHATGADLVRAVRHSLQAQMADVYELRRVVIVRNMIDVWLDRLARAEAVDVEAGYRDDDDDDDDVVLRLRQREAHVLNTVGRELDRQRDELVQSATVQVYLRGHGSSVDDHDEPGTDIR